MYAIVTPKSIILDLDLDLNVFKLTFGFLTFFVISLVK